MIKILRNICLIFLFIFSTTHLSAQCTIGNNNGFEDPMPDLGVTRSWIHINADRVNGWRTTARDNSIEIWFDGHEGTPAYEGNQFAELNANHASTLIKDFNAVRGRRITLSFAHRGRSGLDVMRVSVGPFGGPYTPLINPISGDEFFSDDWFGGWREYRVSYEPTVTGPYEMRFEAVSTSSGDESVGNLLDAVSPVADNINVRIANPVVGCDTEPVLLDGTGSSTADFIDYEWYKDGQRIEAVNTFSVEIISDKEIRVREPGTYELRGRDRDYGCEASASYVLNRRIASPRIDYPSVIGYCNAGDRPLIGPERAENTDNGVYSATPLGLQIDANTGEIDVANSVPGTYEIVCRVPATDFCGEQTSNRVNITLVHPFSVDLTGGPLSACEEIPVELSVVADVRQDYRYEWYFRGNRLAFNTPTITVREAGLYRVEVRNAFDCIQTAELELVRLARPDLSIEQNLRCDAGDLRALYTRGANTEISWYIREADNYVLIDNGHRDELPISRSGVYKLELNTGACVFSVEEEITFIRPRASFNVSSGRICLGTEVNIRDIGTEGVTEWRWTFSDGGAARIGKESFGYTFNQVGLHWVQLEAISSNGCVEELRVPVEVLDIPEARFSYDEDKFWMLDEGIALSNTSVISGDDWGGVSFLWDYGDGTTSNERHPAPHQYRNTGTYRIRLTTTNELGCSTTQEREVRIYGYPTARFTVNSEKSCIEDGFTFRNETVTDNNAIVRMEWFFDDLENPGFGREELGAGSIGESFTIHYPYEIESEREVQVRLVVHTETGHRVETIRRITLVPVPEIEFPEVPDLCENAEEIELQAFERRGLEGRGYYTGLGVSSEGRLNPRESGVGSVDVTYTFEPVHGCMRKITRRVNIIPVPSVLLPERFGVLEGVGRKIEPEYSGSISSYTWLDESGNVLYEEAYPELRLTEDTRLSLIVSNSGGCTFRREVDILVYKEIKVPNAFSPNGDGINDVWHILNLEKYKNQAKVVVYNRYGNIVYESWGYDRSWDGSINGEQLPVGTYFYVITKDIGKRRIAGSVTILR